MDGSERSKLQREERDLEERNKMRFVHVIVERRQER